MNTAKALDIRDRLWEQMLQTFGQRRERPWLAMTVVPLAVLAVMLVGAYPLLAPLAVVAGWWAPRDASLVVAIAALEMGLVGTVWALWGIYALAAHPTHPVLVGLAWGAAMALLAAVFAALHRRYGRGY